MTLRIGFVILEVNHFKIDILAFAFEWLVAGKGLYWTCSTLYTGGPCMA